MAKLTDVKTLDMQDGKVTRVEVNGIEFSATGEGNKNVGDLAHANAFDLDVTQGAYYVVVEATNEGFRIQDDAGDRHAFKHLDAKFTTFRKQSAPDLTQRVDARVSALELAKQQGGELAVGDRVKILARGIYSGAGLGEVGVIDRIDSDGEYRVEFGADHDYYHAEQLERVVEQPTQHTRPITSYDDLAIGMTLKCVKRCSDFTVGETYKIVGKDSDGDFEVVNDGGRRKHVTTYRQRGTRAERFEIVSGGYPAPEPAPAPPKPTFKVGDYAKVVGSATGIQKLTAGDIVEVRKDNAVAFDFRVYRVVDGKNELFDADDLEQATDGEVTQAVAQAKRAAKFTALGRKVDGDFKKGDLVRVTDTCGAGDGIEVGDIIEVSRTESGNARVACKDFVGNWSVGADLIAPVEARVDVD